MFSACPVSDQQPHPVLPEHVQLLIKEGWVGECQPSGAGDAQDYVGRWLAGTTIAKMILSEVRFEIENLFVTLSSFSNYKLSRHSLDWPCRYNLSYFGPSGVRASAVQTKVATILGIFLFLSTSIQNPTLWKVQCDFLKKNWAKKNKSGHDF